MSNSVVRSPDQLIKMAFLSLLAYSFNIRIAFHHELWR